MRFHDRFILSVQRTGLLAGFGFEGPGFSGVRFRVWSGGSGFSGCVLGVHGLESLKP